MSVRPFFSLHMKEALRQAFPARPASRCLHTAPKRPFNPSHPTRLHPSQQRHASNGSFSANARKLYRDSPVSMALATLGILVGISSLAYANYLYKYYIIASFHNYPEEVAKKLRRALYFTNTELNPHEAIKYYKQALQIAAELQMDPFSDEIMGVKIQVSKLMEDIQQWAKAIEVLERIRADNLAWLEQFGGQEHNKQRRTNVLAKTVAISVKLGELYGNPAIYDRDIAEERLMWAVETVLKEKQRRQTLNIRDEDEGRWMSDDETGAALEALAHSYEDKEQHYLATPLFLQALNLYPTKDCHSAILMNNLASSLAQQSPRAAQAAQAYADSGNINNYRAPTSPPATKEAMLQNATTWAQKALDVARDIKPPTRNEECDVGCAVATHNLGEFAEMSKDIDLAQKKYREAISIARAVGFQEGVEQSSARLKELEGKV